MLNLLNSINWDIDEYFIEFWLHFEANKKSYWIQTKFKYLFCVVHRLTLYKFHFVKTKIRPTYKAFIQSFHILSNVINEENPQTTK